MNEKKLSSINIHNIIEKNSYFIFISMLCITAVSIIIGKKLGILGAIILLIPLLYIYKTQRIALMISEYGREGEQQVFGLLARMWLCRKVLLINT
jgi:O-antigen ligase